MERISVSLGKDSYDIEIEPVPLPILAGGFGSCPRRTRQPSITDSHVDPLYGLSWNRR